jgi:glycosyltransferase involved in cell wall biosynthesis
VTLRVAVDVTPLIAGRTGVARYAGELTAALTTLGVDVRPYALGRATVTPPPGVRRVAIPLRMLHRFWRNGDFPPIDWLAPAADVIHTLDLVAPPSRRPSVATVHDLDALEHPELHRPRAVQTQRAQLASLRRVRVVLTNSETTKAALCRRGIDADRVIVGGLGLTGLPASPAVERAPAARASVLVVGTVDPRKGQDVLVRALSSLPHVRAVFVGPDQWQADRVRALADTLGVADRLSFRGWVSDEQLARCYQEATIVCVPSRAEGFGLAVLEAMALGAPVIASDLPAIREVADGAVALVPPGDPSALADGIATLLTDEPRREVLAVAGRVAAGRWTWEATAQATVRAYERALG